MSVLGTQKIVGRQGDASAAKTLRKPWARPEVIRSALRRTNALHGSKTYPTPTDTAYNIFGPS